MADVTGPKATANASFIKERQINFIASFSNSQCLSLPSAPAYKKVMRHTATIESSSVRIAQRMQRQAALVRGGYNKVRKSRC